jgi:hypothetical protein
MAYVYAAAWMTIESRFDQLRKGVCIQSQPLAVSPPRRIRNWSLPVITGNRGHGSMAARRPIGSRIYRRSGMVRKFCGTCCSSLRVVRIKVQKKSVNLVKGGHFSTLPRCPFCPAGDTVQPTCQLHLGHPRERAEPHVTQRHWDSSAPRSSRWSWIRDVTCWSG